MQHLDLALLTACQPCIALSDKRLACLLTNGPHTWGSPVPSSLESGGHLLQLTVPIKSMQVAVRPSIPPLTVEAFPVNLASHVNLSSSLEKEDWNAIRNAAYKKAHYRYVTLTMFACCP